jgi:holo-[acyl-carrier protein] synthase
MGKMKILGIGSDLVDIRRIERLVERFPQRFQRRILSIEERAETTAFTPRILAKRFAAKEACSKACGVGISRTLSFQDMTIHHGRGKTPEIVIKGKALEKIWPFVGEHSTIQARLSLSDELPYVQAFVIITQG